MLKQANLTDFDEIYTIMEEAFPPDERRSYENQKSLMEKSCYSILTLKDDEGRIMAFIAVYDFEGILFAEHFAVSREFRNAGLGSRIITELRARSQKRICLEVEPPVTDITKRRVGFYERSGFVLNPYNYIQPSMGEGKSPIPLMLMTTWGILTETEFEQVKTLLYREVYGQEI